MVLIHKEKVRSNFKGTVIDIETIGQFDNVFDTLDYRRYRFITPVIFGYITSSELTILCAKDGADIEELIKKISEIIDKLEKPLYAFNSEFETVVISNSINRKVTFEKELNLKSFEPKWSVTQKLNIPEYKDPFHGSGLLCMQAWISGHPDEAMAHNRACLLKEKDILLQRGSREPDYLKTEVRLI